MKKKGVELSIQTMILIALGLIVLVLLIWVIRGQISKGALQYWNISEKATEEAKTDKCTAGFFTHRDCNDCGALESTSDYYWYNIGKMDCKTGTCCERGDLKPKELRPQTTPAATPAKKP